ncbi:acetyltransferase [Winogradskyella sp. PC-19]|uniref:acetyltransferase n=1 Tax=Winogradskyella sp. PC-19 TaxID=754417 RepID=UPI000B3CB07C|nr:acetyltransferase [Winogradskyella sp. PC-19]ARV09683.1 acetyltransferase [Winogradskyella sp. PC-19]
MNEFYLYGASGHCKVIIDMILRNGGNVVKVFDDNKATKEILNIKVSSGFNQDEVKGNLIISIGNNQIRKKIAESIQKDVFCKLIHPNAIVDASVDIAKGSVVMAGAIINSSVKIGKHCIINTASSIDHDCVIEDYVHVSPNSTLCGNTRVGEGSHVGAGSVIIQGVTVGKNVTIGAGSVIISDVPDNVTIVGNPGKIIKKKKYEI